MTGADRGLWADGGEAVAGRQTVDRGPWILDSRL